MKHSIIFDGCDNHWDNALPLGNGVFGCMPFFEGGQLFLPMNHYEVYYNISDSVLPKDRLAAMEISGDPGAVHRSVRARADFNQPTAGEPFCLYRFSRDNGHVRFRGGIGESYPCTGELIFSFSDRLQNGTQKLGLYIEDAYTELMLSKNDVQLTVKTITARQDCIIHTVKQSAPDLLTEIRCTFPDYRDTKGTPPKITYRCHENGTVSYTVTRMLSEDKPFVFSGVIRGAGASLTIKALEGNDAVLTVSSDAAEYSIITSVCTDWRYQTLPEDAVRENEMQCEMLPALMTEHRAYWKQFFDRSSVSLPDPFLEKIYVVNQYALDCCSGKDGIMKHHACGLNGLWDIRHPNLWGSMWYWDVNIQAAFAGVFSSNRLDLAKVFSDGLLQYTALAERSAHNVHAQTGCASDYPYNFYYSCWTWCAQYLWFLYEYSLDEDYLRKEAYPLFLKLCEFTLGIFEYDAVHDVYSVYPDISPEQGPLAHNTIITVACAKYLFRFTLQSAEILGDRTPLLDDCRRVLAKLPTYPCSRPSAYGIHLRDSEDAPDNLWIRHPSMLMPVFPIGEPEVLNDPEMVKIISNTLDFLEDSCEIGIFQGSWIAAAAARIGRGQLAYRTLYEKGIDHLARSNGLTAEATDRYLNFCLVTKQPLYYPCMMEFTGEMLAAVNEMLLQSHGGVIRVFPAIPDGDPEYERSLRHGYSISEHDDRFVPYDAWRDVRFDRLLAKGAFEITAEMKDRALRFVQILSKKGGTVRITSPFWREEMQVFRNGKPIEYTVTNSIVEFPTEAGALYLIAASPDTDTAKPGENGYDRGVESRMTYTRRRIFLGENTDTHYQKQLDSMMRDSYLGNIRQANHTVYKFDFSAKTDKDYEVTIPAQIHAAEGHLPYCRGFLAVGAEPFTPQRGYGFADAAAIQTVERDTPDLLRRDFVQGEGESEFLIEAPRGQYEMLVISGDSEESHISIVTTDNSRVIGGSVVKAGIYQSEIIPFVHEKDGAIHVKISSADGYRWKLNALILNVIRWY